MGYPHPADKVVVMSDEGAEPPAIRASDADRERVAEVVRRAVGDGRLALVEGDERQTRAYGAVFRHELAPIVADLEPDADLTTTDAPHGRAPVTDRPGTSTSIAVLSRAERTGEWTPGLTHVAVAVMGGTSLDLRSARASTTANSRCARSPSWAGWRSTCVGRSDPRGCPWCRSR